MKIAIASDLHLEFGNIILENIEGAEVLVLSGDIMISQEMHDFPADYQHPSIPNLADVSDRAVRAQRFRTFLGNCAANFPNVVYVAGNHEFYHGKWPLGITYLREEVNRFSNVHFLEMDKVDISGITFVGGTLWTDMNRYDPLTLHSVGDMMNDFKIIRNSDYGFRAFKPADAALRHRHTVDYIRHIIHEHPEGRYVVVGHHAPSKLSTHPRYANDYLMNGAYSSDLSEFILDHPQIALWTHGHTHEEFDYMIGSTRIVCNPRGYHNYEDRADNFRLKFVEI